MKGVTYYSKYYAGTSINSGVTDELANNGVGPMLCVLKKSLTELTCHNGDEHYQEIVSGEPCLTTNLDYYQSEDYTGQTICVDMCHTCHITEENLLTQSENWTHRSMTTEYNCIHDGTGFIETKQGITSASDCVAECHAMTDAGINICTHTRFITADATVIGNTGPDGNPIAQGDCELYEGALDNTRTCNPDTVGQISSRYCAHEELCHVGCGDLDECAEPGGYNDCAAIAEAGGYADSVTCANTMGSYTCNRGAGSLVPNEAAWSGDDSGGDGLSPWTNNETGDTVTLEAGADGKVTITGLGDAPMEGTIVGNTITVPDPNNPENPLIGTISADGKTIDWTQAGQTAYTMGRSDIDECPPTAATDPCADQAGTVCYNTEPGFSCNCDIHDAQWTFTDGNGAEQTITVTVDTAAQPKAAITYTLGDGSTVTGTLLGSTLEYDDGTGNLKTGTITKNPDGTTTIGWVNQDGSTADTWSRVAGTGNTPAGTNTGTGTTAAPNGATTTPVVTGSGTGQPAGLVTDPTSPVPTTQAGAAATTQAGAVATTQAGAAATNAQGVTAAPTTINGAGGGSANGVGNGVTTQGPIGSGTNTGAGATGSVTGDPHFRINFINQKDICFDISGHNGTVFNLLHEPKSGLIINGEVRDVVWKNHRSHRLAKIGVISPEGARVAFSMDAIETYTSSGEVRRFDYNTYAGMIIVEDIMLSTQTLEKFRHKGASFEVGDSTFSISIKDSKHSLKFYVDNERHLETGVDGLLGFTMAQSYTVSFEPVRDARTIGSD